MRSIFFFAVPFVKEEVTLALESGVTGLIVPAAQAAVAASLARCRVITAEEIAAVTLTGRDDEHDAARRLQKGQFVLLRQGWQIIPVENLLAQGHAASRHTGDAAPGGHAILGGHSDHGDNADNGAPGDPGGHSVNGGHTTLGGLALEVHSADEARLAIGILEKGVDAVVVPPKALSALKAIVEALHSEEARLDLAEAEIVEITPVGLGHRVCVDTLSVFTAGQGMLTGNSAAFTFLVNAETEQNEYVASRPFRVNAGAVHAYTLLPGDRTSYLEELRAGSEVLIVDQTGQTTTAVVGRVKVEKRPMLLIRAKVGQTEGTVFLQNAETIRLVTPGGKPVSVVSLRTGDRVLCRLDTAGRHFGMRITEDITEV